MTIKELKEKIKDLPDNMDVMIKQTNDECRYGMSETIEVRKVTFKDEYMPKKEWAKLDCLVISDEI